jgi:hypothetical protein
MDTFSHFIIYINIIENSENRRKKLVFMDIFQLRLIEKPTFVKLVLTKKMSIPIMNASNTK